MNDAERRAPLAATPERVVSGNFVASRPMSRLEVGFLPTRPLRWRTGPSATETTLRFGISRAAVIHHPPLDFFRLSPRYLGFGEIMMRVAPRGHYRLAQVLPGSVETTFAGAEANVCVSLAMLGAQARYLTMLPENMLGDAVVG